MTTEEAMAAAETAFAMELMSSAALRALLLVVPQEHVRQIWLLGYCQGTCAGLQRATDVYSDNKAVSTGHGDLDVFGRPLRPGS